uniref:Lysosomal-associated transmembrane protein 4B n=1 Tax=Electrophorus electricus TaxID=8005 RepID=A0A4W4G0V4_ELEEL
MTFLMIFPWERLHSTRCCLCCHVRTGTIILGIWYMVRVLLRYNQMVTVFLSLCQVIFLFCLDMCIASAISLVMIVICGMATYGAYKLRATWIIPFFSYQVFDFALNSLVAVSIVVYPNTIQDYLQQLPGNFPYREEVMSMNNECLVLIVLLFITCILAFKAYLTLCVWSCYRYVSSRRVAEVLVYVTNPNDTTVSLPPSMVSVLPSLVPFPPSIVLIFLYMSTLFPILCFHQIPPFAC